MVQRSSLTGRFQIAQCAIPWSTSRRWIWLRNVCGQTFSMTVLGNLAGHLDQIYRHHRTLWHWVTSCRNADPLLVCFGEDTVENKDVSDESSHEPDWVALGMYLTYLTWCQSWGFILMRHGESSWAVTRGLQQRVEDGWRTHYDSWFCVLYIIYLLYIFIFIYIYIFIEYLEAVFITGGDSADSPPGSPMAWGPAYAGDSTRSVARWWHYLMPLYATASHIIL